MNTIISSIASIIILIITFALFGGFIWFCVKYCKACVYYYYNPINTIDCSLAFASLALPSLCAGLIKAFHQSASGMGVYFITAIIGLAGLITGIGLCVYSIRRIYLRCGSWKFAIATYPVEIMIALMALATAGLFLLGAYVVSQKITERRED